jgi:molecular chaperone GrpE
MPPLPNREPPDLHTLLGQLTALRQEVNLQTRATRGQQEQSAEALRQLGQALEELRQQRSQARQVEQTSDDERLRPLLKTLIDVADVMRLAGREVARVQDALQASFAEHEKAPPPPSWFQRLFGHGDVSGGRMGRRQEAVEGARRLIESVLSGYTMSLERIERVLAQQGLDPIPTEGQPFDPEQMEVVEVAHDTGRPTGEVVQEVRRGYLWRGRAFRYAQVRVARS